MSRIHVLPETVVNKIAAGEIVERPAAVVKELVENAFDAGAARLTVDLEAGGKGLIRITDDGCGMDGDDALLAFERHATSKIGSFEDLERVASMGFRGEALAAIAAVSRLTLSTSNGLTAAGTRVRLAGGKLLDVKPDAHPRGTTIAVHDLFFNVPARRKFLRSTDTELQHSLQVLQAYALARWDLEFTARHNGSLLFDAPAAAAPLQRILQLFDPAWEEDLEPIAHGGQGLRITGFVARGANWFSTRRHQYTFINGRLVRDRVLHHAVGQALAETRRDTSRHPALFLWLDLDPASLDVNVHPAKTEVRFRNSQDVHRTVLEAVAEGLGRGSGGKRIALAAPSGSWPDASSRVAEPGAPGSSWGQVGTYPTRNFATLRPGRDAALEVGYAWPLPLETAMRQATGADSGAAPLESVNAGGLPLGWRYLGQLHDSFLVLEGDDGLVLVDQHVAHERVLFERYGAQLAAGAVERQRLLEPEILSLSVADKQRLRGWGEALEKLGFEIAELSAGEFAMTAIPALLGIDEARQTLGDLLGGDSGALPEEGSRDLAASLACHAAIKVHRTLRGEEVPRLLADLFRCRDPYHCPHGRPAVLLLSMVELERFFLRR